MRGGTSKGAYFLASDLPADTAARSKVLLAAMGSPDPRQIDGIGGADLLTSKVAVVGPPTRPDADVDYLFIQVEVAEARTDSAQNCGNILSAVGPFAIERGLVPVQGAETRVRIHMVNTGGLAEALVQTKGGRVNYAGDARIDGTPGSAAPILIDFLESAGSCCGALLPSGRPMDVVDGIEVTLIDNGMPVVVVRAADLGKTGYESKAELDGDTELKARIEALRCAAGGLMRLGDVSGRNQPKVALIAPPRAGGTVAVRMFVPRVCHAAIGVLGAVSVATAAVMPGSVAEGVAAVTEGALKRVSVEHPSGEFTVAIELGDSGGDFSVRRSALLRTARALFDGVVEIPAGIWGGPNS